MSYFRSSSVEHSVKRFWFKMLTLKQIVSKIRSEDWFVTIDLKQWFSNLSWGPPTTAYIVCLPHLTHLIQLISSLVESARLELGVAYERDIQNVWWLGVPRTGLRTTDLKDAYLNICILPQHRKFPKFAFGAKHTSILPFGLALSPSAWMLLWLLCNFRASAYSIISTIS